MLVTSRVRKAEAGDADEILSLCREMHRENGMFTLSDARVRDIIGRAFNRQGAIIGVIGKRGAVEASICLLVTNIWYSDDFHLEDLWNFVRPEFRRSDNAKELIAFAKRCSDEVGIPLIIGVMSNVRTEAKIRLYERSVGKPAGAFFLHQPLRRMNATAHV
jgi:GNAT superfamily N-acetyltransferase